MSTVQYTNVYSEFSRPSPELGSFAFTETQPNILGGTVTGYIATVEQLTNMLGSKNDSEFNSEFSRMASQQVNINVITEPDKILSGSKYDSTYISMDATDVSNRNISITLANFLPITILGYHGNVELYRDTSIISNLRNTLIKLIPGSNGYFRGFRFINDLYTYAWGLSLVDKTTGNVISSLNLFVDAFPSPDILRQCLGVRDGTDQPRFPSLDNDEYLPIRIYGDWEAPEQFKLGHLESAEVDSEYGEEINTSQLPGFVEGGGYVYPDGTVKPSSTPYEPGGSSNVGGGGGNFGIDPSTGQPVQSDDIAPSLPGIGSASGSYEGSVSNAGLFVHYAMNANMLKVVGDWLWADNLGLILAKEVLSILYGSPIESAISLMSYPFNVTALPGVVTRQQNIYWGSHEIGGLSGGISGTAITNPYATIDWGTVQLTEFWGNFLDYAPHTKLELYLPWCTGFVPIDPNECLPGSLRVVTNIELAKGTCLHNVIGNDGRVIATHSGTCGKQLPLTALDTSGKALALVSGAAMVATVGGMALMGGTAGAMYGGFDVAKLQGPYGQRWVPYDKPGNVSTAFEGAKTGAGMAAKASKKPAVMAAAAALRANVTVPRNGTFTGTTAGLGVQYPYLIISRPTQSVPKQYGHHYGYPSNIYAPLRTLRGYTEIGEIHLTGFTCTEDELTEIDSLLKSGVIL